MVPKNTGFHSTYNDIVLNTSLDFLSKSGHTLSTNSGICTYVRPTCLEILLHILLHAQDTYSLTSKERAGMCYGDNSKTFIKNLNMNRNAKLKRGVPSSRYNCCWEKVMALMHIKMQKRFWTLLVMCKMLHSMEQNNCSAS